MQPRFTILNPTITDYYTRAEVDYLLTTVSGGEGDSPTASGVSEEWVVAYVDTVSGTLNDKIDNLELDINFAIMTSSGVGYTVGDSVFNGHTGVEIYHGLGTLLHSIDITPAGTSPFTLEQAAMIGQVHVSKGLWADTVYTTGTGSLGTPFAWMAFALGTTPPVTISSLDIDLTVTGTVSFPSYGAGQDTSLMTLVSGGMWILEYGLTVRQESLATGLNKGYIWIEDDIGIVPNSVTPVTAWEPIMSYHEQNINNKIAVSPSGTTMYKVMAAQDSAYPADTFTILSTSGNLAHSHFIAHPINVNSVLNSSEPPPSEVTITGTNGIVVTESGGMWYVDGSNVQGTGDVTYQQLVTTSGHIVDQMPNVSGTGGIVATQSGTTWYVDGSGIDSGETVNTYNDIYNIYSGITGSGNFSATGTSITHNLPYAQHNVLITLAGNYTSTDAAKVGTIWVYTASGSDLVYCTGAGDADGLPFNWLVTPSGNYLEGAALSCLECTNSGVVLNNTLIAPSGYFYNGVQIGVNSIHIDSQGITLPNQPKLTTLERFYKSINGGRLEKYSDTELRWEAYESDVIGLWNGQAWDLVCPSGTVSKTTSDTTISGGSITYDVNYDVYAKYVAPDDFTLEFQEWAGATSRYETPQRWQGVQVRDLTTEGKKMRWLGIVRLANDSGAKYKSNNTQQFVVNWYNRKKRCILTYNTTGGTWSYNTNSWREWNNGTNHVKAEFVCLEPLSLHATAMVQHHTTNRMDIGFGLDTTSDTSGWVSYSAIDGEKLNLSSFLEVSDAGYHYVTLLEKATSGTPQLSWNTHNGGVLEVEY